MLEASDAVSFTKRVPSWALWVVSLLLVAGAGVYQRITGPSYPFRGEVEIGALRIRYALPRSHGDGSDAEVRVNVPDRTVSGAMEWRRFRSPDPWMTLEMAREGDYLAGRIPQQPPAGKVMYRVVLDKPGAGRTPLTAEPVIIRFRGTVPQPILVPHIFLMFVAMLFSTRAGLEAALKRPRVYRLSLWTIACLAIGGLILGPVVQKFAFDALWTGWPLGNDLTDNKTFVAAAAWIVALWRMRKNSQAFGWVVAASVVLFAVYLIPHSVLGSELDYTQLSQ